LVVISSRSRSGILLNVLIMRYLLEILRFVLDPLASLNSMFGILALAPLKDFCYFFIINRLKILLKKVK